MYFDYSVVKEHKLYPMVSPVLRLLSHIVYRTKCFGTDNIPQTGKLIIACNHIAFSDPAFKVAYSGRTVHFMAKSELFENRYISFIIRNMNAFPVKRNSSDRQALMYAKKILANNWVLGIFPEGRRVRHSSPTDGKTGVAFLARVTGADILPVCLYKTGTDWMRPKVTLRFGTVIKNSELGFANVDRAEELKKATDMIMNSIKKLWEEENSDKNS